MQIKVKCSSKYFATVTHGKGELKSAVLPFIKGDNVLVITDENVDRLYGGYFDGVLSDFNVLKYVLPSGESAKNYDNFLKVSDFLAQNRFCRKDTVIAFGGGVVGDFSGFVASTYMRGITFIAFPTSLLATVDSCIGGKTAINLSYGKNLCGTFYQPSAVYVDLDLLKTLPEQEYACGMGEMVKYCFIDKKLGIKNLTADDNAVCECLKYKAKTVSADEREKGKRKLLNFGHTFGHAIEKFSDFTLSHGVCVVKGINYALILSEKLLGCPESIRQNFYATCKEKGLDYTCDYKKESLLDIIANDKKAQGDTVDFILINKKGKPQITALTLSKVKEVL